MRTGLCALKAKVKVRGLSAIDKRTLAARGLFQWRADLMTDLGGEDNLSAQQKTLIEITARTRLFLEHVDSYLLALPSLVNHRKRAVLPILRERIQLADALARYLAQLGLERRQRDVGATLEALRERYRLPANGEGDPDRG